MSRDFDENLAKSFLTIFQSKEQLRDWIFTFLDIDFPVGNIDPESNSSPVEWLYEAYCAVRDNLGGSKPVFVVYSSRESYKTLSCAAFEVIVMVHFEITVAHMAAIEPQSKKAVQYITSFMKKIRPYLEFHGRKISSQNTRNIEITNEHGEIAYLTIIICTLTGANCIHPDSLVHLFDGSVKPACKLTVSDRLKTWDYTTQKMVGIDIGHISYTEKPAREIVFEDGTNIVVSDDHQVFTQRGWIPSAKVKLGDMFTDFGKTKVSTKYEITKPYYWEAEDSSLDFTRCIKTGKIIKGISSDGFKCSFGVLGNDIAERKWISDIVSNLTAKVTKINIIGYQSLIDIHIDTENEHHKSFLVNSGKLLHNSEHTSVMCVDGDTKILIENPKESNRKRIQIKARDLFKKLESGNTAKALSFNHLSGEFEFNSITVCYKSKKRLIKIKTKKQVISISKEHRMFVVGRGYTEAENLKIGDKLLFLDKNFNKKKQISKIDQNYGDNPDAIYQSVRAKQLHQHDVLSIEEGFDLVDVYDFTVENNNNYIADGYLSHNCVDEVDVVRFPQAYEEAKLIPGTLKGRMPVTIMTSTRKFAFGLMQKEIDLAKKNKHPVLHWNLLDITEKCQPERHLPDEPKVTRYIQKNLPLHQISVEEYMGVLEENKEKFESIEAFAGCAQCDLLPVCKTRLATRPDTDVGGLYKPIDFVLNQFKKINPDMAEAQLLCWKPSSTGLVYPRFNEDEDGNALSLNDAWEQYMGDPPAEDIVLDDLIDLFLGKGISFYAGVDWGFRHAYAIVVGAILPSGEFWIFETLAISDLEFPDMMKYAKYMRDKYKIKKWFADTAQPMFIKSFKKEKMPCKRFTKDVMGGISAIRGQIVDANNRRRLKILRTIENDFLIDGFRNHHFKLDSAGRPTQDPDDEEFADVMDALRYMGQNLFAIKGNIQAGKPISERELKLRAQRRQLELTNPQKIAADFISSKIGQLATGDGGDSTGKSQSGTVFWDFSDPTNPDD